MSNVEPVPGTPCTFSASSKIVRLDDADDRGATFEPLYSIHGNRSYVVYWNAFTPRERRIEAAKLMAQGGHR